MAARPDLPHYSAPVFQITSPACTELEMVVMDWLGKMLGLPEAFLSSGKGPGGGVIQVRRRDAQSKSATTSDTVKYAWLNPHRVRISPSQQYIWHRTHRIRSVPDQSLRNN